jgi:hypothetical protein
LPKQLPVSGSGSCGSRLAAETQGRYFVRCYDSLCWQSRMAGESVHEKMAGNCAIGRCVMGVAFPVSKSETNAQDLRGRRLSPKLALSRRPTQLLHVSISKPGFDPRQFGNVRWPMLWRWVSARPRSPHDFGFRAREFPSCETNFGGAGNASRAVPRSPDRVSSLRRALDGQCPALGFTAQRRGLLSQTHVYRDGNLHRVQAGTPARILSRRLFRRRMLSVPTAELCWQGRWLCR